MNILACLLKRSRSSWTRFKALGCKSLEETKGTATPGNGDPLPAYARASKSPCPGPFLRFIYHFSKLFCIHFVITKYVSSRSALLSTGPIIPFTSQSSSDKKGPCQIRTKSLRQHLNTPSYDMKSYHVRYTEKGTGSVIENTK